MKETDIELITKFLENELNEEEVKLFKSKYEQDPEFTGEVNLRSKIYISLGAMSRTSGKAMAEKPFLRKFPRSRPGQPAPPGRNLRISLQYAAILVALIAVGVVVVLTGRPKPGAEELFASYYNPPEAGSIPKPRTGADLTDFSYLLNEIDRQMAFSIDTLQTPDEYFYFGIYCMNKERFTEAIYAFNELIRTNDREYKDGSEWYLALCYLKTGKIEEAIRAFSEIAISNGHDYQQESIEILARLR
jgi:tetratricopeptide (TPR) repeat protein